MQYHKHWFPFTPPLVAMGWLACVLAARAFDKRPTGPISASAGVLICGLGLVEESEEL
jgi:hypothetical protein